MSRLAFGLPATQAGRLMLLIGLLAVANLLSWGAHLLRPFASDRLFSSGVAFAADGTELRFNDLLTLKGDRVNYQLKVRWDNNINIMQEAGTAWRGWFGEAHMVLSNTHSIGPSVLSQVPLDQDMLFSRSYLQSGKAQLSAFPLGGDFQGLCLYLIDMKKVHCAASVVRSAVGGPHPSDSVPTHHLPAPAHKPAS